MTTCRCPLCWVASRLERRFLRRRPPVPAPERSLEDSARGLDTKMLSEAMARCQAEIEGGTATALTYERAAAVRSVLLEREKAEVTDAQSTVPR